MERRNRELATLISRAFDLGCPDPIEGIFDRLEIASAEAAAVHERRAAEAEERIRARRRQKAEAEARRLRALGLELSAQRLEARLARSEGR